MTQPTTQPTSQPTPHLSRRHVLLGGAGVAGAAALAACSNAKSAPHGTGDPTVATGAAPSSTAPSAAGTTLATPSTTAWVAGAPASYVPHGAGTRKEVALTFHLSGDPTLVATLLDLLKGASVPATVMVVGTWITAHPALTRRVVAEGHELGNHTEHHLNMGSLSRSQVLAEIVDCGKALTPFIGGIGKWFRPSATVVPSQLILDEAGKAGYPVSLGYDVDSTDNTDPGSAVVLAKVKAGVKPGSIVSMHFGHAGTITAFPHVIAHLRSVGLTPVTVSTLLAP